jgi:lysophospholipase L1-like esterase
MIVRNAFWATLTVACLVAGSTTAASKSTSKTPLKTNPATASLWTGTWGTAPQLVEPNNKPPQPGLTNNTLRQIVRVSIGGETLRLRFCNDFGKSPVTLNEVSIAAAKDGWQIDPASLKTLSFGKKHSVTIAPDSEVYSDPIRFTLTRGSRLTITLRFGATSDEVTGHPGSRTTSYILAGNAADTADFSQAVKTDHWYIVQGIDVLTPKTAGCIVALGNSITDGRGSGTNRQNRWTDILSERLLKNPATSQLGVLNMGIGGNCVVRGGLGPTALSRFKRDVLSQSNVKWLILLEGINDLGSTRDAQASARTAQELIRAYTKMIDQAHAKGIKVYGVPILPFEKSFYDADHRQAARDTVNAWIRHSGKFDAVIDLDPVMGRADNPRMLREELHSGDLLHPNEAGYKVMGEAIDLNLFTQRPTVQKRAVRK